MNAMTHGLLSRDPVLPDEDPNEFAQFERDLTDAFEPRDKAERFFIDLLIRYSWRRQRAERIDTGLWVHEISAQQLSEAWRDLAATQTTAEYEAQKPRWKTIILDQGRHDLARDRIQKANQAAKSPEATLGRAFLRNVTDAGDAFSRIARYERHFHRSMMSAYEEYRRLQAQRPSAADGEGDRRPSKTALKAVPPPDPA